jgi:hypothetical protein
MIRLFRASALAILFAIFTTTGYTQSDFCASATPLSLCVLDVGDNIGYTSNSATDDSYAAADICAASVENTAWYTFTAPIADTYTVTISAYSCSGGFGLQTGVLTGPCGGPYTSLNCGYIANGTTGSYTVVLAAGQQVFLVLDGDGADECGFTVDFCGTACNADAGTATVLEDNVAAGNDIYLCANTTNCVDLISNNDFVLPPAQPGEIPELFWAIYTCAPTTNDPATDPCYSGSLWSGQDFSDCNPSTYGLTGEYWFVPITADDGDGGGNPNGVIDYDQNGDGCFDMGTPVHVVYLNPTTFGIANENCYNGTVSIAINGGMPEYDGSNYTITNTGSGSVVPVNVSHGQSVVISGLNNGDSYSFSVIDAEGCVSFYNGGPYTACACPTIDFAGLPATLNCDDSPVNLSADQTGFVAGQTITPCFSVFVSPTNAQTGNSMLWFVDAVFNGGYGPALPGGLIGSNTSFTGYFSYASPSATNTIDLCETTAGANMTYAIFDCHSGALITSGTWVSDGSCTTVSITPPGSLDGIAAFSGSGITTTDFGTGQFDPSTAGTGTHTITYSWDNENGCSGTATHDIDVVDNVVPTISNCPVDVNIVANNAGCTGTATWTAPTESDNCSGLSMSSTHNSGDTFPIGTTAVTYTATDAAGNTASCTFNVIVTTDLLVALDSVHNALCFDSLNGQAFINVSGGTPGFDFDWDHDGFGDNNDMEDEDSLAAGSYNLIVTDANGCTATATNVVITEPAALTVSVTGTSNPSGCALTDGAIDIVVTGGTTGYDFDWDNDGTGDTDDLEDLTNIGAGTYNVTVIDTNGCTATNMAVLIDPSGPVIAIDSVWNNLCNGDTLGAVFSSITGGTAPFDIDWDNNGTGQTNDPEDVMNLGAGNYSVIVTDDNGCISTANATVTEPTAITTTPVVSNILCNGDSTGTATLSPTGGTGNLVEDWGTVNPNMLPAGTHVYTVTDDNGCVLTDSVTITEPSVLTLNATSTDETPPGNNGTIDLTVGGGVTPYNFLWDNSAVTEDLSGLAGGTYIVEVTDGNGCTDTISVVVNSTLSLIEWDVLNVQVYPNPSSGEFTIQLEDLDGQYSLKVENTEGKLVYTTTLTQLQTQVHLNELEAGVYFVNITNGKSMRTIRWIKQ